MIERSYRPLGFRRQRIPIGSIYSRYVRLSTFMSNLLDQFRTIQISRKVPMTSMGLVYELQLCTGRMRLEFAKYVVLIVGRRTLSTMNTADNVSPILSSS